jgi:hypothetical protein
MNVPIRVRERVDCLMLKPPRIERAHRSQRYSVVQGWSLKASKESGGQVTVKQRAVCLTMAMQSNILVIY